MTKLEKIQQIIKETDHNYKPYYDFIPRLIRDREYSKGIEVGVFCGGHSEAILANSKLNLLVGVDPFKLYIPSMPRFEDQEDFDILYDLTIQRLSNYGDRYQHLREESDDAYHYYLIKQKEQYDFVFIDGLHTYEQCKKDLENYSQLIRKGGIVAGHDIDHPYFPLLTKAIEDFAKENGSRVVRGPLHSWYMNKTWGGDKIQTSFKEEDYLQMYPDVMRAVLKGKFKNGLEHYQRYGQKEGRRTNLNDGRERIDTTGVQSLIGSSKLVLKGYVEKSRVNNDKLNIVDVPEEFKQIQNIEYPQGNKIPFERYFEQNFVEERPNTLRKYLPIHWTSYYVNNKYGKDKVAMQKLQDFIDSLPKDEKYFTIIQYDDGILNNVEGLDLLVYSMGCKKPGYYPIPLISQPLCSTPFEECEKDIAYSFFGANTHPIREQLVKELGGEYVQLTSIDYDKYIEILKRSTFVLCPRGYGITSFRMFEAIHFNAIPIYISDEFWEPFNIPFEEYGIKIRLDQIEDIYSILTKIDVVKLQKKVKEVFENYITYSSCYNQVIETLL